MSERVCRWLITATFIVVPIGVLALWLVEGGGEEQQFWRAVAWYASRQWSDSPLLWIASATTGASLLGLYVVAWRGTAAFRRHVKSGAVPTRELRVARKTRLVQRAREVLEPELNRSRARVERVIDVLLGALVDLGASELSLQPSTDGVAVHMTVGMDDLPVLTTSQQLLSVVAERLLFIIAVDQRETEAEGIIRLRTGGSEERIRIRLLRTAAGPHVRLQLLRRGQRALTLERLGMPRLTLERFRKALGEQTGLVLVSGPRGRGLATTLYAAAHFAARKRRPGAVASIEPDVRLELPFMHQVEVGAGVPAALLQSLLRDPFSVLLLRGIDDADTVRLAVDAAASRLVVVSVGAGEPVGALARVLALGCRPEVLADVFRLSATLRLLPRLCSTCRRQRDLATGELEVLVGHNLEGLALFEAVGCRACEGKGHKGLVPLYWSVEPAPWLTDLLRRPAAASALPNEAASRSVGHPFPEAVDMAIGGDIDISSVIRLAQEAPFR